MSEKLPLDTEQKRIRHILNLFGITELENPKEMGYGEVLVDEILNGKQKPSEEYYSAFSKTFLNVNLSWVKTGEGKPFRLGNSLSN